MAFAFSQQRVCHNNTPMKTVFFAGRETGKRRRWTTGRIKFDSHLATSLS
jgi:hypothetical protein